MMRTMRKAQRQKDADWALEVFDRAPYVTVSMTRPESRSHRHSQNIIVAAAGRQMQTMTPTLW